MRCENFSAILSYYVYNSVCYIWKPAKDIDGDKDWDWSKCVAEDKNIGF